MSSAAESGETVIETGDLRCKDSDVVPYGVRDLEGIQGVSDVYSSAVGEAGALSAADSDLACNSAISAAYCSKDILRFLMGGPGPGETSNPAQLAEADGCVEVSTGLVLHMWAPHDLVRDMLLLDLRVDIMRKWASQFESDGGFAATLPTHWLRSRIFRKLLSEANGGDFSEGLERSEWTSYVPTHVALRVLRDLIRVEQVEVQAASLEYCLPMTDLALESRIAAWMRLAGCCFSPAGMPGVQELSKHQPPPLPAGVSQTWPQPAVSGIGAEGGAAGGSAAAQRVFVRGVSRSAASLSEAVAELRGLLPGHEFLFHGTSWDSAQSILDDGVDFDVGTHNYAVNDFGNGFYLTDSLQMAFHFAQTSRDVWTIAVCVFLREKVMSIAPRMTFTELDEVWIEAMRTMYRHKKLHHLTRPAALIVSPICANGSELIGNKHAAPRGGDTLQFVIRRPSPDVPLTEPQPAAVVSSALTAVIFVTRGPVRVLM